MNQETIFECIDEFITELSKVIPTDLIQNVKAQIESQSNPLFQGNFESFKIGIVVDTNAAISTIKHHINNKSSILFHLNDNPIFTLYAPDELKSEILKYIKNEIPKNKHKKWLNGLLTIEKIIEFKNNSNAEIKKQATDMIGKRDPNDIPFVETYLNMNAQAIFTFDKDFNHKDIRVFKISDLERVARIFQKGTLSYYAVDKSVLAVSTFLIDIILTFFKKIFYAIKHMFKMTTSKINNISSHIIQILKKLPIWAKILVIGVIIVITGIIIFSGSIRRKIISTLRSMTNSLWDRINGIFAFLKKFINALIGFIAYIEPNAIMIIKPLSMLLENIKIMEKEFQDLITENTFA